MTYEPKEWKTGEVITADALNHIENGIADFPIFIVNQIDTYNEFGDLISSKLDKTWNEIYALVTENKIGFVITTHQDGTDEIDTALIVSVASIPLGEETTSYLVMVHANYSYTCTDPDDYPSLSDGEPAY